MPQTTFPYKGTLDELRQINRELADIHEERAELNLQEAKLQEHKTQVLRILREKATT